jgi:mannose-6-phosphate isomerase-like protein (cupin superfamily)
MTILPSGGGRPFLGGRAHVKVEAGAADFSVFEQQSAPGLSVPLHVHERYDEAFYVLDGEMHFVVGDTTGIAEAGAFVFVPRGEAHRFWNGSQAPTRMLAIGSPQVQALVEELEPLIRSTPPDARAISAAFARHHSRVLMTG